MRGTLGALSLTALLLLTGCSQLPEQSARAQSSGLSSASAQQLGTIRISSGLTPETRQAAYLYQAALEEAGYQVQVLEAPASRSAYLKAMGLDSSSPLEGQATAPAGGEEDLIDITPDLSGDLLLYLTDNGKVSPTTLEEQRQASASPSLSSSPSSSTSPAASASSSSPSSSPSPTSSPSGLNVRGLSSSDIISYLDRALPDQAQLLTPSAASNRYGFAITQATAAKYEIKSMADLAAHCPSLTLTAPASFVSQPNGLSALEESYACQLKDIGQSQSAQEQASQLIRAEKDLAYIYSASSQIQAQNLLFLDDPNRTQLEQKIIPITRSGSLPQEVRTIIDGVSSKLDSDSLIQLNSLTTGQEALSPEEAAQFWLTQHRK